MSKRDKQRFLEELPKFLKALNEIREKGFFDFFAAEIRALGDDESIIIFRLQARGFLPNRKNHKRKGVGPFLDPVPALEFIRRQLESKTQTIQINKCSVNATDWSIWSEKSISPVGKRGEQISIELSFLVEPKKNRL